MRAYRIVCGKVIGSSGVVDHGLGQDFTVSRISAGVYIVFFKDAFKTIPVVTASVAQAVQGYINVDAPNERYINVNTFNTAAAATDMSFAFTAVGF